jgi:hypothetical protein
MEFTIITEIVGKTMTRAEKTTHQGEDALVLEDEAGTVYTFAHSRDCCENVNIESITGDLADLIGVPLWLAEEAEQRGGEEDDASSTWTFYKFATSKGYVDVRFYGTSNGYYSEGVYLSIEHKPEES